LTTYVLQGSAATDLRGSDTFNSGFLRRSFRNVTVKKIMKIGPLVTTFCHLAQGGLVIMTHCVEPHAGSGVVRMVPFPGRMSYEATKPGLASVLYLSMRYNYGIVVY